MISTEVCRSIALETPDKILFVVVDGLGGLPGPDGRTELEAARTPELDALASRGACGLHDPIGRGITPGSGPAHFALFGYDPLRTRIGRGALAALGIGFEPEPGDVAARINFCTQDENGIVTDRRAGRIPTETCARLAALLDRIEIPGAEVFVRPVKEHRAVVIFRGEGLSAAIHDTDPQRTGAPPIPPRAQEPAAERMRGIVEAFLRDARAALAAEPRANGVLLRGFAPPPAIPSFGDCYRLEAAAIAVYPDYKGIARACGMRVLEEGQATLEEEFAILERHGEAHTFFYLHCKKTDSYGEDGNREAKIHEIEALDALMPRALALRPKVLVVTGDHSTPCRQKAHSYHPVPILIAGEEVRPDGVDAFGESACAGGSLGRFPATEIMALAMGNALKLKKFGA